jgi:[CysO sulfur-carrier protein]-S-L-cysteine hydrolase
VEIAPDQIEQIVAHAREEAPNECCGVVAVAAAQVGDDRARAMAVRRARNVHASPKRFEIDGRDVLAAMREFEAEGWEIGAIYHSHTHTEPFPSQTDVNFAVNWPGVEWIIVGLADPARADVRSYLIEEGVVREVALEQIPV